MSRWFRFYDGALDDPKVQLLPPELFKAWVNLLCLAARNDGWLPPLVDVAFALRMDGDEISKILIELQSRDLVDKVDGSLRPHNWDGRQFKSDVTDPTNAERQKRFRERHAVTAKTVTVTATRTDTESDTESEQNTDTEKKNIGRSSDRPTLKKEDFEEFWKARPRRKGPDPKKPAENVYRAKVRQGAKPLEILTGCRQWAITDRDKVGTEFLPQTVKWLRDERWRDYVVEPTGPPIEIPGFYAKADSAELAAWDDYYRKRGGPECPFGLPRDRDGGWFVKTQWPPGFESSIAGGECERQT